MPVATFPLGPLQTNSYLIHKTSKAVAIDVGGDPAPMLEYLNTHHLKLEAICITHRHFDHMYGVAALEEATGARINTYQKGNKAKLAAKGEGALKDIAPSLLAMMGLPQPAEMTGQSLIEFQ